MLDSRSVNPLAHGREVKIDFPGTPLREPWHRHLADLEPCSVPADGEALYEATCFAADNNALEVRSLQRSGPTRIPQVERARKALFECPEFLEKGIWDRNLFDGRPNRAFRARKAGGLFRLDFGEPVKLDRVVLGLMPGASGVSGYQAEASADLTNWTTLPVGAEAGTLIVESAQAGAIRYLRFDPAPVAVATVQGMRSGRTIDSSLWRASNLFARYRPAVAAWSAAATLREIAKGSYLAVPISGRHGNEGATVGLRVDGKPAGCPDRAVSFASNVWEYQNYEADSNYTYFFPLAPAVAGKRLDVVLLSNQSRELKAELWITAYPIPFAAKELILEEA
jgi:hypothetical protein